MPKSSKGSASSSTSQSPAIPVKYVLITGTTHGLGKYCAKTLLQKGYHVTMAVRNIELAEKLAKEFAEKTGNSNYDIIPLELSSLASVQECARIFKSRNRPLDILINNAGMLDFTGHQTKTLDGFESHFGVNYLGHYLLTRLLIDKLQAAKPALIISLSSIAQAWPMQFEDYNAEKKYTVMSAYGRSKMAQLLFADELQRRYGTKGVTTIASHPGGCATNIYNTFPRWCNWLSWCIMPSSHLVLLPPSGGAAPTIFAITHPELWGAAPAGSPEQKTYDEFEGKVYAQFYGPLKVQCWRTKKSRDISLARKLWEDSEGMIQSALHTTLPRALPPVESAPASEQDEKKEKKEQ